MKTLLASKSYPRLPQFVATAVLMLVLLYAFVGSPHGENNLGVAVTWSIWWSILPLSTLLLGRIWCGLCPLAFASDRLLGLVRQTNRTDGISHNYSVWPAGLLLLGLSWAAVVWRIEGLPQATGITLLLLLAGAIAVGLFYGRRTWCKSICPIGVLAGLYAMVGLSRLKADDGTCNKGCGVAKRRCPASTRSDSCLLREPLPTAESSFDCNLCGDCVKSCRHGSPRWHMRLPIKELAMISRPSPDQAAVVMMIVGVVLIDMFRMTNLYPSLMKRLMESGLFGDYHVAFSAVFLALVFSVLGAGLAAGLLSSRLGGGTFLENFGRFGHSYLLVVVAAHFGSVLFHMLVQGDRPILAIGRELGLPIVLPAVVRGSIYMVNEPMQVAQLALLAVSTIGTIYVIWQMARAERQTRRFTIAAPHFALAIMLSASLAYLLSLPMGVMH